MASPINLVQTRHGDLPPSAYFRKDLPGYGKCCLKSVSATGSQSLASSTQLLEVFLPSPKEAGKRPAWTFLLSFFLLSFPSPKYS